VAEGVIFVPSFGTVTAFECDGRLLLVDTSADRFASDLHRPAEVNDQWLRELTATAAGASQPILLGGHSLVGPGIPLLLGGGHRVDSDRSRRWASDAITPSANMQPPPSRRKPGFGAGGTHEWPGRRT